MYKKKMPLVEDSGKRTGDLTDQVKNNCTTFTAVRQAHFGPIASLLLLEGAISEEKKLTFAEVKTMLGLTDVRRVQAMVEREREVAPILTTARNGGGMWLADTSTGRGRDEVRRCAQTIINRGAKTIKTGKRLRRLLQDLPGQIEIEVENGTEK